MNALQAHYFDGKRALRHPVSVLFAGGRVKVIGRDVDGDFDADRVRASQRIGNTPRWLYLPDGGACVTADNDLVDRFARETGFARGLHALESRPVYAALAVALVVFALWLLIDRGVPLAVEHIARQIPLAAETALGEQTLAGMDRYVLRASRVPPARQAALRAQFDRMARSGGETAPRRLEFRASPAIGPNAFALPAGIVVVTDELVRLAGDDREILAVLAHELGHVHHRHTMRRLLEGSATALIIAGVTGDISATTSLAASAPALLLQTKYSRDNEREADRYAVEVLRRTGVEPRHFVAILQKVERESSKGGTLPGFLSSHPSTKEREALAREAAAPSPARETGGPR